MIPKKQRHRIHTLFALLACFGIIMGFFLLLFLYTQKKYSSLIFPNVYINSVSVAHKNKEQVMTQFYPIEKKLQKVNLTITYNTSLVSTFSAQTLNLHLNTLLAYNDAYAVGRSPSALIRVSQTISSALGLKKFGVPLAISYSKQPIIDFFTQVQDQYEKRPKNARFQFESGIVTVFEKEENGLHIETTKAMLEVDAALKRAVYSSQNTDLVLLVRIYDTVTKPTITLAQTNTYGIEDLIAEGTSNYTHSIAERVHNLLLAASKFNGVLIPKGATFSFNETVGDISSSTGYQPAYIIKEGKTVLGDGGGVCQVSTTLFRAVLNAGLPIVEHHSHAYRVGYYENDSQPGLDATVFGPTVDFKFINNTPANILIQSSSNPDLNTLSFKLYGKKDNRVIELTTPIVSGISAPPDSLYQDDPTLKKGVVKQVDFAAWGARAFYTYTVRKNNKTIYSKEFNISYRPWRAVFLVGTAD